MSALTHKQGGLLWHTTGRKFWEPGTQPAPTTAEASALIKLIMEYIKEKNQQSGAEAVSMVRKWFEDFELSEIHWRYGGKKKSTQQPDPQQPELPEVPKTEAPTPKTEKKEEKKPKQEKKKEDKPTFKPPVSGMDTQTEILAMIDAEVKNIWLHGPAGCGKTTIVRLVADALELPCTVLSCNSGTSPAEILGYKFPEPHHSPISAAFSQPGIVLIDDCTFMDETTAGALQAILANGAFTGPAGHVTRHAECTIICTANTTGDGGDRVYSGNSKWDGATMDRFAGSMIKVDYSAKWEEENTDPEVLTYVHRMRETIRQHNLRRIASTRTAITGSKLKSAGFTDWKTRLTNTWTTEEKAGI